MQSAVFVKYWDIHQFLSGTERNKYKRVRPSSGSCLHPSAHSAHTPTPHPANVKGEQTNSLPERHGHPLEMGAAHLYDV